jgi:Zn-dependent protease/predicted transcriptional regulator
VFGKRITLFKLFGFNVRIDISWVIIAFLVTWSLASGVFPRYLPDRATWVYWLMGVCGALGLFISIIFHELCHSLIARRFGLPMGSITLFVFGGVAEMNEEPPSPKAEFLMAAAGPLSSLFIGSVFIFIDSAGASEGWPGTVRLVLAYLGFINLMLAIFNLIPAFPLDGGRILRSALWQWKKNITWATRFSSRIGEFFGSALIILGIISFVTENFITGMWWVLIGFFLRSAAQMSYQSLQVHRYLEGEKVERFMNTAVITVPHATTINALVENFIYHYHYNMFPVNDNHNLKCISIRDVKEIPREEWSKHTVDEYSRSCSPDNTVYTDDDVAKLLAVMNQNGNSRFMVIRHDGTLAGIITLKDLMHFISIKMELDK